MPKVVIVIILQHQRIARLPEPRQKWSLGLQIQCIIKSGRIRIGHLRQNQTRHLIFKLAETRLQFRRGNLLIPFLGFILSLYYFYQRLLYPEFAY